MKEGQGKERDENGVMEIGDEEGNMYYRPRSLVGSDEQEDKSFMSRR